MKIREVQVKETYNYNTVTLTAECDQEPTDKEILELRARARNIVEIEKKEAKP